VCICSRRRPRLTGPGRNERAFTFFTPEGAEALRGALERFDGGRLVVNLVDMPIKCPVAPLEFTFLADWHLRERGIRSRIAHHRQRLGAGDEEHVARPTRLHRLVRLLRTEPQRRDWPAGRLHDRGSSNADAGTGRRGRAHSRSPDTRAIHHGLFDNPPRYSEQPNTIARCLAAGTRRYTDICSVLPTFEVPTPVSRTPVRRSRL